MKVELFLTRVTQHGEAEDVVTHALVRADSLCTAIAAAANRAPAPEFKVRSVTTRAVRLTNSVAIRLLPQDGTHVPIPEDHYLDLVARNLERSN